MAWKLYILSSVSANTAVKQSLAVIQNVKGCFRLHTISSNIIIACWVQLLCLVIGKDIVAFNHMIIYIQLHGFAHFFLKGSAYLNQFDIISRTVTTIRYILCA